MAFRKPRGHRSPVPADGAPLALTVNGAPMQVQDAADATLANALRSAGHTDVKLGCERGECGACTVLIGDRAVNACTTLAALVTGPVTTPAGLAAETEVLRRELAERGGFQCGFCTPGHVAAAAALLRSAGTEPDDDEIRSSLNGNLCRCTGYTPIVEAVRAAARQRSSS